MEILRDEEPNIEVKNKAKVRLPKKKGTLSLASLSYKCKVIAFMYL